MYNKFIVYLSVPPLTSANWVWIKNTNCWEVPKSGTIPIVLLVPVKNYCMAFAVEERVLSSFIEITCAFPILKSFVSWYETAPSTSK